MALVDGGALLKAFPFANEDSYTRLAYSHDGSKLFVAGPASFIRAYDTTDERGEVEAQLFDAFDDAELEVTSLDCAPSGDVLIADIKGNVSLLEPKEPHELKALITRCNLPARDARFNRQGTKCAVASEELDVKVIDIRDTRDMHILAGHTKAVRAVSWHPDGTILTTSSVDGTLRVWDLTGSEPLCLKTIDGIIPIEDAESMTQCSAVWHPHGGYFVAATKAHEIAVIQRDTWSRIGTFSTDGHATAICALAWSPNGNYLASAGKDGYIIVWDSKTRTPVTRTRLDEDAGYTTEIAWQPDPGANALSVVTANGCLARWHAVIAADRAHPTDLPRAAAPPRAREPSAAAARGAGREYDRRGLDGDSLFGANEDEEDDWIIDDLGGDDDERRPAAVPSRYEAPRSFLPTVAPRPKGQPSFQPGSTPWQEKRRYLAFNEVGVVHAVDREAYQVITVDFHDHGANRGFHWEDYSRHTMASLGQNGVLVAGGDDIVAYRPYSTWTDATGEWTQHLPKGEQAIAIGMGPKLAIVATDGGYLRFMTASGLQTHLIDLGREVIAVAIGSEFAFVVHRPGAYAVDDVSYTLIDLDTYEFVQRGPLPCFGETTLRWIGFCDDEMPALFKSNGVFSVLDRCRRPWQARWTPVLDTRLVPAQGETKLTHWPVWATATQMHHVLLKGEESQPAFPTPLTFAVDFQVPALDVESAEGQIQEQIMRSTIITTHMRDSAAAEDDDARTELLSAELGMDKALLKLFNLACKAERLEQALECAKLLSHTSSIEAAIKLADFFSLGGLRERIERLRNRSAPSQPEKRDSRWASLQDDRTITAPVSAGPEKRAVVDLLSMPFDAERRARSTSARLADRPLRSVAPVRRDEDSGFSEDAEPAAYDDENDDVHQRTEFESDARLPVVAIAAATSRNLFAKKARPAIPPLSASSAANTQMSTHPATAQNSLKKSDSFLTRVEEQHPKGPRQALLFGSKPPVAAELKKKAGGRKRKSDERTAVDEEDDESQKAPRQTLANMFARPPSTTTSVTEATPEDEDETQIVLSPDMITA